MLAPTRGPFSRRKEHAAGNPSRQVGEALKALRLDDEVLDWVVTALKESRADEKRYHDEAIATLQEQYQKLQNRLDAMYVDKLDRRITQQAYDAKSEEWRLLNCVLSNSSWKSGEFIPNYRKPFDLIVNSRRKQVELTGGKFDKVAKNEIWLPFVRALSNFLRAQSADIIPPRREVLDALA